ncbi:hypothetical protein ACP70R_022323 [Stipagrostis hirtigluma subsp. patula]
MAKKKGTIILLESDDEGPAFPSPPAKVEPSVIEIDDAADPKGKSTTSSRKLNPKDVAKITELKPKSAASFRKSKVLLEDKRTHASSSGVAAEDRKKGPCSAPPVADVRGAPITYYTAPNVMMSVRLHEALDKLFDVSISKSPFYVVKFAENQVRTGLFFTKEYSDSLPEEAREIVISSYHDRTYITGRLVKYSNGRSCITSGWGTFIKRNNLVTGSEYALQFHKCTAADDQLCLLIFKLA